jgi:phosphoribosylformimino-5-aminoimidazole carboxamide ribotide isomerase
VIGSAATDQPQEVIRWLREFGAERICLAFDVRREGEAPQVCTHGWTNAAGVSLWDAIAPYRGHARHILCTDIARDGTLLGPNLELYREAVARYPPASTSATAK